MDHLPVPVPAAALRTLRRASWFDAPMPAVADARAVLTVPMGDLALAWVQFCQAFDAYVDVKCAAHWNALQIALSQLDRASTPFFGPSGWERTRDRPRVVELGDL